jgi:aminobenzoyl-glutamate utilization protein B
VIFTVQRSVAKRSAVEWINAKSGKMAKMSDTLFAWAEPGLREQKSARLLIDYLRENGFNVEEGVSGMPTAFVANWGERGPVIGLPGGEALRWKTLHG